MSFVDEYEVVKKHNMNLLRDVIKHPNFPSTNSVAQRLLGEFLIEYYNTACSYENAIDKTTNPHLIISWLVRYGFIVKKEKPIRIYDIIKVTTIVNNKKQGETCFKILPTMDNSWCLLNRSNDYIMTFTTINKSTIKKEEISKRDLMNLFDKYYPVIYDEHKLIIERVNK